MSYEYMLGMGATTRQSGSGGRRRPSSRQGSRRVQPQQRAASREEILKKISDNCGMPCTEELSEPAMFSGTNQQKLQENTRRMKQKKCAFRCLDDDGAHYYCCPSQKREKQETAAERTAREQAACGGQRCSQPGMMTEEAIKIEPERLSAQKNEQFSKGCVLRCEEGGWLYYCCPSARERQEPVSTLPGFSALSPAGQDGGVSWKAVALLGALGLGATAFVGFFVLRKKKKKKTRQR